MASNEGSGALLFRESNPLAAQLSGSSCIFRLLVPEGWVAEQSLQRECERIGAVLTEETSDEGQRALRIVVSHAHLDAFGGMFLWSVFGAESCSRSAELAGGPAGEVRWRSGEEGGFRWYQFVCDRRDPHQPNPAPEDRAPGGREKRTLTQRILAHFARLPLFASGHVGLAVAKDDVRALTGPTYLGNSLVIVELAAEELGRLAAGSSAAWRTVIAERSNRLKAIALRRPTRLGSPEAKVTVSSVGEVERLGWAQRLDPEFFEMIPTPAAVSCGNVVLWGNRHRQALAVCGRDEHPVIRSRTELCAAWQEALVATHD